MMMLVMVMVMVKIILQYSLLNVMHDCNEEISVDMFEEHQANQKDETSSEIRKGYSWLLQTAVKNLLTIVTGTAEVNRNTCEDK